MRAGCPGLKTCAPDGLSFGACECAGAGGKGGSATGGSGQAGSAGDEATEAGAPGTGGSAAGLGGAGGTAGEGGAAGSHDGGSGGEVSVPCDGMNERAFRGHCYLLGSPDTDYPGAREACREWGGTLVAITSEEEQNFLHATFGDSPDRWIGLSAEMPLGPYAWETGEPVTYTKWNGMGTAYSEPSNLPGELCVLMAGPAYMESWSNWNNITCTPTTAPYLCER